MQEEIDVVVQNRTWDLTDLQHGHRAITLKWVFRLKKDQDGKVVKHKVRACGSWPVALSSRQASTSRRCLRQSAHGVRAAPASIGCLGGVARPSHGRQVCAP